MLDGLLRIPLVLPGSRQPQPVLTRPTPEGEWELVGDCPIERPGYRLTVPDGYRTDLASIPRALWWLIDPAELSLCAPVAHDYLYRHGGLPDADDCAPWRAFRRIDADRLFRDLMKESGVEAWKWRAAYVAVRAFGRHAWRGQ